MPLLNSRLGVARRLAGTLGRVVGVSGGSAHLAIVHLAGPSLSRSPTRLPTSSATWHEFSPE